MIEDIITKISNQRDRISFKENPQAYEWDLEFLIHTKKGGEYKTSLPFLILSFIEKTVHA